MQPKGLKCPGRSLQCRTIWTGTSAALRLRDPGLREGGGRTGGGPRKPLWGAHSGTDHAVPIARGRRAGFRGGTNLETH